MGGVSLALPENKSGFTCVENDIRNNMVAEKLFEGLGSEWREEEVAEPGWQTSERLIGGCKECNSGSLITRTVLLLSPFPGEPVVQSDLLKGRSEDKEAACKEELV